MKRWRLLLALFPLFLGLIAPAHSAEAAWPAVAAVRDPAALMNPLLGTSHDGNTFPGADTHFGMSQWDPDTPARPPGGFYAYSDNVATGFSLNHIPGPGCGAMGDILVLPTIGAVDGDASGGFSHAAEKASAGAYPVDLYNGVDIELTTTQRSGMARFTFPTNHSGQPTVQDEVPTGRATSVSTRSATAAVVPASRAS